MLTYTILELQGCKQISKKKISALFTKIDWRGKCQLRQFQLFSISSNRPKPKSLTEKLWNVKSHNKIK